MTTIIGVRFKSNGKMYYFDPQDTEVTAGTGVIVETARGLEYGECVQGNTEVNEQSVVQPLKRMIRIATEADMKTLERNRKRADEAFLVCKRKIEDRGLEMNLVTAECTFDMNKLLFYFTADGRVDFRELVKDLAGVFRTRIELRQIGVRDEAKMIGGLGCCGRELCCSTYLDDFHPVSINMAKDQNLSLNPAKISGVCGRLMCCLKYEHEAYAELQKITPRQGSVVDTPEGRGKVITTQMLRGICKVQLDDSPEHSLTEFRCEDCTVVKGACRNRQNACCQEGHRSPLSLPAPHCLPCLPGSAPLKRSVQGDRTRRRAQHACARKHAVQRHAGLVVRPAFFGRLFARLQLHRLAFALQVRMLRNKNLASFDVAVQRLEHHHVARAQG